MKKHKELFWLVVLVAAATCLLQLSGCGGSATVSPYGTLRVGITDKPSDAYEKVVVSIREVRIVPPGKEDARDDDPGLPLVVKYDTPHTVDVLSLRFQQEVLGTVTLPVGSYNQVRLILDPNPGGQAAPVNYLTLKTDPGTRIPLKTPSGQQSGLKILGKFDVKAGTISAILIDFDPNTAIVQRGNGDYNLKPTGIRIIQPSVALESFGSITGTIFSTIKDWTTATVSVAPAGSSQPIAAGTVFSNYTSGRFEAPFSTFVPGGAYRVHVNAAGFAAYSSPVTTVTTGQETALGEVSLTPIQ